jgi:phage-related minor tail protein
VAKIKGITIEIGGNTQPLNKALSDVNKKSKDLQSELRQVDKLLKLDPKNTELLAQKQKLLAEAVQNSKEKLDRLKTTQQQVNEQFARGEISEEQYRAFQREVAKAEQELKGFEKQLSATAKTTETWKDKLDKAQTSLKNVGAKMTDMGKTLSMSVTAPIVAAGAASFKMAADLQDAMGATEQIFKNAADSVKTWADNLDSYYGIAEGEALEYANMMGTMLVNIGGLTEEEASKQAQTLIELAGDLTAMYGGTTADAVRALTGALKGNNTMLDNYGMAANDAMVKTKALEMGLYDGTGQMDLATKQAATLALIMEQSAAAQGQAAREAEGASGGMRAFATEIKNLSTDIGEVLLPVITPLLANLNDIVKKFGDLSPEMKKAIVVIAGLAAAIGPLLILLGTLSMAIGAISLPVVAVIAGIAALGAAIVWIYNNWKENGEKSKKLLGEFADYVKNTWDNIKQKFVDAWNNIKDFFKKWGDEILLIAVGPAGWAVLLGRKIAENWDSIKTKTSEVWNNIKTAITRPIESARDTVLNIIQRIKDAFANLKITIPKPKLPHIEVNWRSVGIGDARINIPKFSLNWYKMGGIFDRPSIIGVGEAGTEAVIPLDKMPGLIADALRDAMGGGQVAMAGGITVQNMYVRNDQDIKLVARELYNLQQQNARGRGLR